MIAQRVARSGVLGVMLLEVVLALAVTAVLCALALSAYETHRIRAQITSSVGAADAARRKVEQAFARDGEPPADRRVADISGGARDGQGEYVDSLDIVDGRIDLKFGSAAGAAISGHTLSLTPFETAAQQIVWVCGNRVPAPGLQPLGFANGSRRSLQVLTNIQPRYLPSNCR